MDTSEIDYESYDDLCSVCGVHGRQPCVDDDGNDRPDHAGRAVKVFHPCRG
jgi:hypothetical protein